jgi:hypothetical protein
MRMGAEKFSAFDTDGSKAKTCAFCGAGDDTYVINVNASSNTRTLLVLIVGSNYSSEIFSGLGEIISWRA